MQSDVEFHKIFKHDGIYFGLEAKAKRERNVDAGNLELSALRNTFGKEFNEAPF